MQGIQREQRGHIRQRGHCLDDFGERRAIGQVTQSQVRHDALPELAQGLLQGLFVEWSGFFRQLGGQKFAHGGAGDRAAIVCL